jgi:hypothetical protein
VNRPPQGFGNGLQEGFDRLFQAIRQNGQHHDPPAGQTRRHDGHKVAMPLFQGNLVQAQYAQRVKGGPIYTGADPAFEDAFHSVVTQALFTTDVLCRAIHQLQQDVFFIGRRVGTPGIVPRQLLGRRRVVGTCGTFKPFRLNLEVDPLTQDRQMP